MKRVSSVALWLLTITMACAAPALAAEGQQPMTSDKPIHVVSDSLEVDNNLQIAHFIGDVKATQGDVKITSDKLDVYYERADDDEAAAETPGLADDSGQVRKVIAIGHVKITQTDRVAVGQKATYWAGGRKILLEGNATVWKKKNQVSGEKITVFLDENRTVVHGKPGKRVSVTLTPGKDEE